MSAHYLTARNPFRGQDATRILLTAIGAAIMLAAGGCATMNPLGAMAGTSPRRQAQNLDPMLQAAGFTPLSASTPRQKQDLKSLPALSLHYYADANGINHYWVADPEKCGCLFTGDEAAYQRYENIKLQNQLTERRQDAAEANMRAQQMNGPFGPPGLGPFGPPGFSGPFGGFGSSGLSISF
ncbi:MAG: hypothetical protein ACREQN_06305 [Candidatus Binataceae bacterium]